MANNRAVLDRAIAKTKVALETRVKALGEVGKDVKKLRLDTKWRQIQANLKALNKRVDAINRTEKLEADLVAARAQPKAPKAPKEPKAAPAKGKKK